MRGGARPNSGGKRPGAGRKSKAEEMGLAHLLEKAWPMPQRVKVLNAMYKQALKGNVQAAALLLAYGYGKPTEKHEHSGENGGPLEIIVSYVSKPTED